MLFAMFHDKINEFIKRSSRNILYSKKLMEQFCSGGPEVVRENLVLAYSTEFKKQIAQVVGFFASRVFHKVIPVASRPLESKVSKIHRARLGESAETKSFCDGVGIHPVVFREIAQGLFEAFNEFGVKADNVRVIRLELCGVSQ